MMGDKTRIIEEDIKGIDIIFRNVVYMGEIEFCRSQKSRRIYYINILISNHTFF